MYRLGTSTSSTTVQANIWIHCIGWESIYESYSTLSLVQMVKKLVYDLWTDILLYDEKQLTRWFTA